MDGMLSQDEINALLSGMANGDVPDAVADSGSASSGGSDSDGLLTDVEKDAIGEVANISMGTSATTLYSLVNRKVNITTPVVSVTDWDGVISEYEKPCVFIQIQYKVGLDGSNILILKEGDVKIITDLMMGGDGTNTEGELGELHLSAICEAMNQMMGSSATSLSSMLGKMIDISPPTAELMDLDAMKKADDIAGFLTGQFVKIAFRMQIDELVDSTILQLYPLDFARSLYDHFMSSQEPEPAPAPEPEPMPAMGAPMDSPAMGASMGAPAMGAPMGGPAMGAPMGGPAMGAPMGGMDPGMGMNMGMGMQPNPYANPYGMGMMGQPPMAMPGASVNIQPAQFQTFSSDLNMMPSTENIELIKDVPLEVTVELGRTHKSISEILDFAPGTIVELDKIAGEPIDVLVNGKYVAKGEVVVIEESFGVRITDIIK